MLYLGFCTKHAFGIVCVVLSYCNTFFPHAFGRHDVFFANCNLAWMFFFLRKGFFIAILPHSRDTWRIWEIVTCRTLGSLIFKWFIVVSFFNSTACCHFNSWMHTFYIQCNLTCVFVSPPYRMRTGLLWTAPCSVAASVIYFCSSKVPTSSRMTSRSRKSRCLTTTSQS